MSLSPRQQVEIKDWLFSSVLGHLPLLLLPLLSLFLYLSTLHHDFVLDDVLLVVANPYIKSWKYLPEMLTKDAWNVWDHHNYWRPMFSISLALDYSLWGLNPFGFHLTNILIHAINTVLLYSLGKKLQNTTCAIFASLLFALHPIQAHAVNVISIRGDLLAAFFTLLSLQLFLSGRTIPFAIALLLALLSKEISIVLPVVLIFAGLIVEEQRPDLRHILAFVILGIYFVLRLSLEFSFALPPSIFSYHASWDIRLLLAFKALALYFRALANLFEMPHPFWAVAVPSSLDDLYVISGILVLVLLVLALWRSFKRDSLVAFGLGWFVIYFLPISNVKELNQTMAEHWLYIPMIGLCLAFGAAVNSAFTRLRGAHLVQVGIRAVVAVFLILAALVVREKTRIYQDEESFLLAAIRANPQIAGLYRILGSTYLARQDITRAKEFYIKALTLDPDDFTANYMLGSLLDQTGQLDEAKIYLERVTRIKPTLKLEFYPVAHAWELLGDKEKALFYYRKALELNPESDQLKQKVVTLEKTK